METEKEIIQAAQELQTAINKRIQKGDKSVVLAVLNKNMIVGLTKVGQLRQMNDPGTANPKWKKVNASAPPVNEEKQMQSTAAGDNAKFIEELKVKSPEQLGKMNKASLLTIIRTINEGLPKEKQLVVKEGSGRSELADLIYNSLHNKTAI